MDINFLMTCPACPEQYDATNEKGERIAYIRLRWGYLSVDCPDYNGEEIYHHQFKDKWKGSFKNEKEKEKFMKIIKEKIRKHYSKEVKKNG